MKTIIWMAAFVLLFSLVLSSCSETTTIIGSHGYRHYECKQCEPKICIDKHCWKHFNHDCRKGKCKK